MALVEHETGQTLEAKLSGQMAQFVDIFLHGVADEDQRADPAFFRFLEGVLQYLGNLGPPGKTGDRGHHASDGGAVALPLCRLAFAEAAIKDQLHLEATKALGRLKHLGLGMRGLVPGWLAAGRGVQGKDQAAAPAARRRLGRPGDLVQEGRNVLRPALARQTLVVLAHVLEMGSHRRRVHLRQGLRPLFKLKDLQQKPDLLACGQVAHLQVDVRAPLAQIQQC